MRSSPAFNLAPQPGVRLSLVPPSLMTSWRSQWNEHIDTEEVDLDMQLFLVPQVKLDDVKMSQLGDFASNVSKLKADKKGTKLPDRAHAHQERFLVLATVQSYENWINIFKYKERRVGFKAGVKNLLKNDDSKYQIEFGIACADECHEEYRVNQGRAGKLAILPGKEVWCWGLTGTLFESTPRSLEGVLYAIESHFRKSDPRSSLSGWRQDSHLNLFRGEIFDKLCKDIDGHEKIQFPSDEERQEAINELKQKLLPFLTSFMIRRTAESMWFGHTIVPLKPMVHHDVYLAHNSKFDDEIDAMKPELEASISIALEQLQDRWLMSGKPGLKPTQLGFANLVNTQYKMKILATCPYLVKLTTGPDPLNLKNQELEKWRNSEHASPYNRHLKEIVQTSPKLLWLRKFIMDLDKTKDIGGNEHKLVILSQYNVISFIVKLVSLVKKFIHMEFADCIR